MYNYVFSLLLQQSSHLIKNVCFKPFKQLYCFSSLFQIEFKFAEAVTDQQLVGAQFVHPAGRGFVVSGYDSSDLNFFVQ
jgi:hypothetical protein